MSVLGLFGRLCGGRAQIALILIIAVLFGANAANAGPSLVINTSTGQVILAQDAGKPWYPASLTKLMTAYLTFDALSTGHLKLQQKITVSRLASRVQPSKIGLKPGSAISVDFALSALLVYSANDMAVVLAEAVGGNVADFVTRMNAAAQKLGMNGSHFVNPHGLFDPHQVTTARDIALLALAIEHQFPQYWHYFSEPYVKVGKKRLRNRDLLLGQMPTADGMKTGYVCESGFNLVGSAVIDKTRYIAIVFGAKTAHARADIAQVLLETAAQRKGRYANAPHVLQIADQTGYKPGDMRDEVCKGRDRVSWAKAEQLSGWGVSFGRFSNASKADALLAGRLASTHDMFSGGESGIVKVPGTKEYVALLWSLKQHETMSVCAYLHQGNDHCEVITPAAFSEFAKRAGSINTKALSTHRTRKVRDRK